MTLLDNTPADQADYIIELVYDAVAELHNRSGYLGSIGSGVGQKIDHVMNNIPDDFEPENVEGVVYGLLLSLSLGDPDRAAELAMGITDEIEAARR